MHSKRVINSGLLERSWVGKVLRDHQLMQLRNGHKITGAFDAGFLFVFEAR
ncbi:MAG: hypothetical protein GQ529_02115 [Methyloprofundus sp.]|nr:hypothetical protein [Methyloprofundus sp.]